MGWEVKEGIHPDTIIGMILKFIFFIFIITAILGLITLTSYLKEEAVCSSVEEEGYDIKLKYIFFNYQCYVQGDDGKYIDYDKFRSITG